MRLPRVQIFWRFKFWAFQVAAWRYRGVINLGPFQILRRTNIR